MWKNVFTEKMFYNVYTNANKQELIHVLSYHFNKITIRTNKKINTYYKL